MKAVPCILCGADDTLEVDFHPGHGVNQGGRLFLRDIRNVLCRQCGLMYNNPRMEAWDLAELYQGMAHAHMTVEEAMANPPTPNADQIRHFRFVRHHFPPGSLSGVRVLEVGCAMGTFLGLFGQEGATVHGLEPSPLDAEFARRVQGVSVTEAFLAPGILPRGAFDLAAMFFVLEHVPDPLESLVLLHDALEPEGLLLLTVPNAAAPFVSLTTFFSMGHLHSFTPVTLSALLGKAGFRVLLLDREPGLPDTGKDFESIRVLAQRSPEPLAVDTSGEFARSREVMRQWRSDRTALIDRMNAELAPRIARWRREGNTVLIYGGGTHSLELMRATVMRDLEVAAFVDNTPHLQNGLFLGRPVIGHRDIDDWKPDAIVLSARPWERQIWERLAPQRARGVEVVPLYRTDLSAEESRPVEDRQ